MLTVVITSLCIPLVAACYTYKMTKSFYVLLMLVLYLILILAVLVGWFITGGK